MTILYVSFLLASTFPFIQIVPSESYNQPYALLLGSVILALRHRSTFEAMPQADRWALIGLALLGVLVFLFTCFPYTDAQELKYLLNYITPLVLTGAVFACVRSRPRLTYRVISVSVMIWCFVATVQSLVNPTFGSFLVGNWGGTAEGVVETGRGVLGLAPEPTHHGFHMLLLGATLMTLQRSTKLASVCVAEAVLLARSASAVLSLLLAFLVLVLRRPARLFVFAVIFGAGAFLTAGSIEHWLEKIPILDDGTRIFALLRAFLSSPTELLTLDYSVNARIGGAAASFAEILNSWLMPHGMSHDNWLLTGRRLVNEYSWLLDISLVGPPSGVGVILFQVGFLAIPFLIVPFVRIVRSAQSRFGSVLAYASVFVFFFQYYISSPDFSLLYGCAIYVTLARRAAAAAAVALPAPGPIATDAVHANVTPQHAAP